MIWDRLWLRAATPAALTMVLHSRLWYRQEVMRLEDSLPTEAWAASALTAAVQALAMPLPAPSAWECLQLLLEVSHRHRLVVTRPPRLDKVLPALVTEWALQQVQRTTPPRPPTPLPLQATAARALPHLLLTRQLPQATLPPHQATLPPHRAIHPPLRHTARRHQLTEMVRLRHHHVTARPHQRTRQRLRPTALPVHSTTLVELRTRLHRRATARRHPSTAPQARLRGTIIPLLLLSTHPLHQARDHPPSGRPLALSSHQSKCSDISGLPNNANRVSSPKQ